MKRIFLLLATLASFSVSQAQNMVAHYTFDNFTLADETLNTLTLTTLGTAPTSVPGKNGYPNTARRFNGTGYYKSPNSPKLALTTWTMSAIVRFNSFATTPCQVSYIVCSDGAQQTGSHYALEVNDNQVDGSCANFHPFLHQFYGMTGGPIPSTSGYPAGNYLSAGAWYCLTATYNGDQLNAYIDGILIYSRTWGFSHDYTSNPTPAIFIGSGEGGFGEQNPPRFFLNADVDDVKIWDGVLNVDQSNPDCSGFSSCWAGPIKWLSTYPPINPPSPGIPLGGGIYEFTANDRQNVSGTCVKWTYREVTVPAAPFNGPFYTSGNAPFYANLGNGSTSSWEICAEVVDCILHQPCRSSIPTCLRICVDGNTGAIVADGGGTKSTGSSGRNTAAAQAKTTAGCTLYNVDFMGKSDSNGVVSFHAHPPLQPNECLKWTVDGGMIFFGPSAPPIPPNTQQKEDIDLTFPIVAPSPSGTHNVCVEVIDCATRQPCGASICFDLCADQLTGKREPLTVQQLLASYDRGVGFPYPNPTDNQLSIPINQLSGLVVTTIVAVDGRVVARSEETVTTKSTTLKIATDRLTPGVYMLNVTANGQTVTKRFAKN